MEKIAFRDVLKSRNLDGHIYVCDVWKLLHGKVTLKEATEIRDDIELAERRTK